MVGMDEGQKGKVACVPAPLTKMADWRQDGSHTFIGYLPVLPLSDELMYVGSVCTIFMLKLECNSVRVLHRIYLFL